MESCCTCATILDSAPAYSSSEKPLPEDRRVECCARIICGKCIYGNYRFSQYCPYCQVTSGPSSLPQGLRDPPSYATSVAPSSSKTAEPLDGAPPPYTSTKTTSKTADPTDEKAALAAAAAEDKESDAEDTLHFLDHNHDTVASLSLRYGVPASALRRTNNLTSDHLLLGRRTVLIPGEFYKAGVSLSPRPVEGEEEELRKSKIRRFMISAKVSNYDVAQLYLEQSDYDISAAVEAFFADEAWEREHPNQIPGSHKKKPPKEKKNRVPFWRGL